MSMGAQTIGSRGRALLSRHAAAIYGMAGRLWLVLTGPVTIVVLASQFTPQVQGYFFTFVSLAAARIVAELGLGQVIIVKLAQLCPSTPNPSDGVPSRVAGLIRFTAKWFAGAGFIVGALLCSGRHGSARGQRRPSHGRVAAAVGRAQLRWWASTSRCPACSFRSRARGR